MNITTADGVPVGVVVPCEEYGSTIRWASKMPAIGTKLFVNPSQGEPVDSDLPPLPLHPEPHTYAWTDKERDAILEYGKACAARQSQPVAVPVGVPSIARLKESVFDGYEQGERLSDSDSAILRFLDKHSTVAPPTAPQADALELADMEIIDIAEDFKSQYTHGGQTYDGFNRIGFARAIEARIDAAMKASKA